MVMLRSIGKQSGESVESVLDGLRILLDTLHIRIYLCVIYKRYA